MKVTHLVGSILATSALACSAASEDAEGPEVLETEHEALVNPDSNGVLVFARSGEATVMALRGNNLLGIDKHTVGGNWWPILTGDFNRDGRGDITWRRSTDSRLSFWRMLGNRMSSYAEKATSPRFDAGYGVPMLADFNDDGVDDIFWQGLDFEGQPPNHTSTPISERWIMAQNSVEPTEISSSLNGFWQVKAAGRFWGDGSNRANLFWVSLDGTRTRFEVPGFGSWEGPGVSADWEVKGVADFDANGSDDILWRNRVSGDISIWPIAWGWPQAFPLVGNVGLGWSILGAGDLDGDNVAEIIWRDNSGNVAVTLLHPNYTVKSYGPNIALGTGYSFVGVMKSSPKFGHGRLWIFAPRPSTGCAADWVYTVKPTNGPQYTRTVAGTVVSTSCRYALDIIDMQDTYTVTWRDNGCYKVNVMAGESSQYSQLPGNWCAPPPMPPPTMPPPNPPPPNPPPNPPPTMSSGSVLAIWGGGPAPMDDGPIWYRSLFPASPIITGRAVGIKNANNFLLGFPRSGSGPEACENNANVVLLGAQATMTPSQMTEVFGTSQPTLPITITACAATLPPPSNIIVFVDHIR